MLRYFTTSWAKFKVADFSEPSMASGWNRFALGEVDPNSTYSPSTFSKYSTSPSTRYEFGLAWANWIGFGGLGRWLLVGILRSCGLHYLIHLVGKISNSAPYHSILSSIEYTKPDFSIIFGGRLSRLVWAGFNCRPVQYMITCWGRWVVVGAAAPGAASIVDYFGSFGFGQNRGHGLPRSKMAYLHALPFH